MSRQRDLPLAVLVIAAIGLIAFLTGLPGAGLVLVTLGVVGVVAVAVGPRERDADQLGDIRGRRVESVDDHALREAQSRLLVELAHPSQLQGSLRPRLTALAVDRLGRRGVSLTDPGARELLGEPLWAFLTGPPRTRTLPLRELETLLTRVEAL